MFKVGDVVAIPLECPITEREYGVKSNPQKALLLGSMQKIRKIKGNRITVGEGWYFCAEDLAMEIINNEVKIDVTSEPVFFNPENLMV
jgi:hypothetical protein